MDKSTFVKAIEEGAKVVASKEQISADLAGEAAILNLKSGTYFGLNSVGARIWSLVQTPTSVAGIRDVIVSEYEVDPARSEQDILRLLDAMAKQGLVQLENETPA